MAAVTVGVAVLFIVANPGEMAHNAALSNIPPDIQNIERCVSRSFTRAYIHAGCEEMTVRYRDCIFYSTMTVASPLIDEEGTISERLTFGVLGKVYFVGRGAD